MKRNTVISAALTLIFGISLSGCVNLFGGLDSPSGDAQILSAARACLDQQDYACALSNYQKLSAADSDIALSEQAFLQLDQAGAGIQQFITAFGKGGNPTQGITRLAGYLSLGNFTTAASIARRGTIMTTFINDARPIANANLQAFTKFITSAVMAASILSENSALQGSFQSSDLVSNPATCTTGGCAAGGPCSPSAGNPLIKGAPLTNMDSGALVTDFNGASPTAFMLTAALKSASDNLSVLTQSTGYSFGFSSNIIAFGIGADNADLRCFRATILNTGIGVN